MAVIDGATDSLIVTIPTGDYPIAFAHNPQQNRIYVANYYGSTVSVIRDAFPGIAENRGLSALGGLKIYPNPAKSMFH
ncbi:MAG: YVTN family beta-propeller repeat-containing protein, partial [candidate division WOR-3 bacterium]|nr:YVTN family beta-propeller repeat-containing protein [candidate division WOR-3 bacterium]